MSAYEGQYEYENGTTLIMVRGPNGKILYASINGARYPLRPARADVFLNNGDIEVLFVRGDHGEIIGYRELKSTNPESNPLFRLLDRNKRLPPSKWDFRPDLSNVNNFVQAWLRPRDMMKIGILLANKGTWNGQQLMSAEWITQLTSKQSDIGDTPYGFFFWLRYLHINGQHVEAPQMSGNGGQKVILFDKYQAILVLTGGGCNEQSHTNKLLANFILPGLAARADN